VLASTTAPLTGARIHRLTGRSYPQVHHVLGRLVDHGLAQHLGNGVSVITEDGERYLNGEFDTGEFVDDSQ